MIDDMISYFTSVNNFFNRRHYLFFSSSKTMLGKCLTSIAFKFTAPFYCN